MVPTISKKIPFTKKRFTVEKIRIKKGEKVKKIISLLLLLLLNLKGFAINYEIKVGVSPYEAYDNSKEWFKFSNGLDYGLDIYQTFENGYSVGIGAEIKRKIEGVYTDEGDRLYTYYLIGKKEIGRNYSLVSRIGRTSQKEFDSKFYAGIGIEKRIKNINLQLIYEGTKLKNNKIDKDYGMLSLKIGYIFGDGLRRTKERGIEQIQPQNLEEIPILPTKDTTIIKKEEYVMDQLNLLQKTATNNYEAYEVELTEKQKLNLKELTKELERLNIPGVLEIRGLTDSSGSKSENIKLAIARSNKVKIYLSEIMKWKFLEFKIIESKVGAIDYLYDNSTYENRKKNRRVEVKFNEKK